MNGGGIEFLIPGGGGGGGVAASPPYFYLPSGWNKRWVAALGSIATARAKVMVVGDSIATGDGATSYYNGWTQVVRAGLIGRGYPVNADYYPNARDSFTPSDFPWGWVGGSNVGMTNGIGAWHHAGLSTATAVWLENFTVPNNGRYAGNVSVTVHYVDGGGTWQYQIGAAGAVTVTNTATAGAIETGNVKQIALGSVAPGTVIQFGQQSVSQGVIILGVSCDTGGTGGIGLANLSAPGQTLMEMLQVGGQVVALPGQAWQLGGMITTGSVPPRQPPLPLVTTPGTYGAAVSTLAGASSGAGGVGFNGGAATTYFYAVTFKGNGGESLPIVFGPVSVGAAATQVALTSIPVDAGQGAGGANFKIVPTTQRNVYRTAPGGTAGGPFFLISASAPTLNNNSATTFTDTRTDAQIQALNIQPPTANPSISPTGYGFPLEPDLAIIYLGANDARAFTTANVDYTFMALDAILQGIQALGKDTSIIITIPGMLSAPNLLVPGVVFNPGGALIGRYVKDFVALAHAYGAALYSALGDADTLPPNATYLNVNANYHPTDLGHAQLASAYLKVI